MILRGDCLEVMPQLDPVDAIVTDPPYGLEFMGKGWDRGVPGVTYWQEALRVLKPGGHLLAFGGTRVYCAKASKRERGEGNNHPTVKPVNLMRWLVRLVTPPGEIVLDPFAGSGSTGVAAKLEGFHFIGIEKEEAYADIAETRVQEYLAVTV